MQNLNDEGREELSKWQNDLKQNSYLSDSDLRHSISYYLTDQIDLELSGFAELVIKELIPLVMQNNLPDNLPKLSSFDSLGNRCDKIIHHPSYSKAGDIIYSSGLMERFSRDGGLTEGLAFHLISSFAGEAGHNCPIACSAGIQRVLRKVGEHPKKEHFLSKLQQPSFSDNYKGAQFVTEIQGGSDVGKNVVTAEKDSEGNWRITGEKWFCSNANADLILMTARYLPDSTGTKGLGLFLVPAKLDSGENNGYIIRRLKEKLGTRTLATAEIEFHQAIGYPMGPLEHGFKALMENVLHLSRLFNSVCVIGMARRALLIATKYAERRTAFGNSIIKYPLVQENLARIKSENTALLASIFATTKLQDELDLTGENDLKKKMLVRLLANLNKYLSAVLSVQHIHHCLDVLAGNGTIETFSPLPQLLRDCIICENWEGTHNTLRMQILRDIQRYQIDEIFIDFLSSIVTNHESMDSTFQSLREDLLFLKNAGPELQFLKIKSIVDKMSHLYAASQLYLEAMDQQIKGSNSKMNCFLYFAFLYLNQQEFGYDERHFSHIQNVIGNELN